MANFIFDIAKRKIMDRDVTFDLETNSSGVSAGSDKLRVALFDDTLTVATHGSAQHMANSSNGLQHTSGANATEIAMSGYTTGGEVLSDAEWDASSTTGANSFAYLKGDDVAWTNLGASGQEQIKSAVLYYDAGGTANMDSSDIPIAAFDFVVTTDGSNVTLQWAGVTGSAAAAGMGIVLKLV